MVAVYETIEEASETVAAIIGNRIVPATLELLDNFTIRAVEAYSHAGLPVDAKALLLIEVDGHPGEHGTGLAKAPFLAKETGRSSIIFSRRLRKAFDPNGILNPGKITG